MVDLREDGGGRAPDFDSYRRQGREARAATFAKGRDGFTSREAYFLGLADGKQDAANCRLRVTSWTVEDRWAFDYVAGYNLGYDKESERLR